MANQEQLEILKQGVDVWNKWLSKHNRNKINLSEADLSGADLNRADLRKANLSLARLRDTDLRRANLLGADLREADLRKANLREAHLYNADLNKANLSEANLTKANLYWADLGDANLSGANFNAAILRRSNLSGANLNLADLFGADLVEADLSHANLVETDLSNADLKKAMFSFTNLVRADLRGAGLGGTIFCNIDLSETVGLEKILHDFPSIIGMDTIQLSKGKLPVAFLRGCGLTDLQIEMAKLAAPGLDPEQVTYITNKIYQLYLGDGIQYYSCFISYNSKDEEFAKHLHDDLQDNGVRCWFAPEDMKIGDPIRPTIDRQIRVRDKLLVILSENSVKSEWVGDEVEEALEEEQKGNRLVLFPIRLDYTVLNTRDDWAAKIKRRRHIGDFSNWKDKSSYQKAIERLLRDLKATGSESTAEGG